MLNISLTRIDDKIKKDKYKSFALLGKKSVSSVLIKLIAVFGLITILAMFLPWTQNIRSKGYVTTMSPDDRPQTVQAVIGGKIEKWYVVEGQKVKKGDTIMHISEVKEEYLDPAILARTDSQIQAKSGSKDAYASKAVNLQAQYKALVRGLEVKLKQNGIKLEQNQLKYESDSIDLVAAELKYEQAQKQLDRMQQMYDNGLKSLTDLESKSLTLQEANAKVVSLKNKLLTWSNERLNLLANINAIENDYQNKIAKSQSDRNSALSSKFDSEAAINKLQSQYNSYSVRQDNYYIKSPVDGVITKAIRSGLGEIIKAGEDLVSIMPTEYELAVEMYVNPQDVPLLEIGERVMVQFDGWPAIVFSGWPQNSYGTFAGKVFAIDFFISKNGKYRIMVAPEESEKKWPDEVRIGGGANTITLLKDVSVGYELWRQLNGFPPDYYKSKEREDVKTKAPLRKVK